MFNRIKKSNFMSYLLKFSCLLIFFALLIFNLEVLHGKSVHEQLLWIWEKPFIFVLNCFIGLAFCGTMFLFVRRVMISIGISSSILLVLVQISKFKKALLGEPLMPWDIFQLKNVLSIMKYIQFVVSIKDIIGLFFMGSIYVGLYFIFRKQKLKSVPSISLGAMSFAFLVFFVVNFNFIYKTVTKSFFEDVFWEQNSTVDSNGVIASFLFNLRNIYIGKPANYSFKSVSAKLEEFKEKEHALKRMEENTPQVTRKPNVVVVMSEAFWDPRMLPGVRFSKDPMPNFDKLSRSFPSGKLLSPVFGGKTANVEFELLTGHSLKFLPEGSVPYQQYVNKPQLSLASVFGDNGYETRAIHSYYKWFYKRDKVYPLFGFDKFIGIEDMQNPQIKGLYVSDKEFVNCIKKEFEEKQPDSPLFLFTVSMQNHGTYFDKRYQTTEIQVKSDKLDENEIGMLETYTQGIMDADRALGELTDYFSTKKEPVILIFFGDHLPALGYNNSTYVRTGFIEHAEEGKWDEEESAKMYSTPLIFWNNFTKTGKKELLTGASELSQRILDMAGIEKPEYYQFIKYKTTFVNGSNKKVAIDEAGRYVRQNSSQLAYVDSLHWLFEYDLMFGKNYLNGSEKKEKNF